MTRAQTENRVSVGQVFGRWTVLNKSKKIRYFDCQCVCGNTKSVRQDSLLNGQSSSCGCFAAEMAGERQKTHGHSNHVLWQAYFDMNRRCYDPKRKDYKHYGGKGVRVCEAWRHTPSGEGFVTFLSDMGEPPFDKAEIERTDSTQDYCAANCVWASRKVQTNNTSQNKQLEFHGVSLNIAEWSHLTGIPQKVLVDRVGKLKWAVVDALTTPQEPKRLDVKLPDGSVRCLKDALSALGIKLMTFFNHCRLKGRDTTFTFYGIEDVSVRTSVKSEEELLRYVKSFEYATDEYGSSISRKVRGQLND